MIDELLPPPVATAEAFSDPPAAALLPSEEAVVAQAGPDRRREFTTVRWCARRAMVALRVAPVAVLPGKRREPLWPPGVVGSLTHCNGYRAAALAPAAEMAALGIDAELDLPLPPGVLAMIARPEELARLALLPAGTVCWDKLLFSIKESVYKAWHPLTGQDLDFTEASVTLRQGGTFDAKLLHSPAVPGGTPRRLGGCWLACEGLIVTATTLSRSGSRR